MAIYRLEAKIISREGRGRSVVAAAAYRAGLKLRDELKEKVHDYARRLKGVIDTKILAPAGAEGWVFEPQTLWNTVEKMEKRKDAQLAREIVLSTVRELPADLQFKTAVDWAMRELVAAGMVAHLSLHHDKEGKNPHVHILCTMRKLDGDKFASKKAVEWNDKALLVRWRETWAHDLNVALAAAGRPERVDHRSLKDRGIDREPEPKIGPEGTGMRRRGVESRRFQLWRRVKMLNEVKSLMRAITQRGEIPLWGTHDTWFDRSATFLARLRHRATEVVKGTWQRIVGSQRDKSNEPEIER